MTNVLTVYKPIGVTPLQMINKFRLDNIKYKNIKIGFAGRLDPMAHGLMLLLVGEENKNRNKYLSLDKEYEFEVLFGVATDTYDSLGLIKPLTSPIPQIYPLSPISLISPKTQIGKFIKSKLGKQTQPYPPYSSKTVNGKPLYWYARNDKLKEIKIPEREIEIYSFELLEIKTFPADEIKNRIIENIKKVEGDFRQKEILEKWEKFFSSYSSSEQSESSPLRQGYEGQGSFIIQKFPRPSEASAKEGRQARTINFKTAKFKIRCSSGTYVRSIVNELGEQLGTGAIAIDIKRTKVGKYILEDLIKAK